MIRPHARWDRLGFRAMRRLQLERLRRFLSQLVFPFSDHYRILWRDHELDPRRLNSIADLARNQIACYRRG